METESVNVKDRVRENTPEEKNQEMDKKVMERMYRLQNLSIDEINKRLAKIRSEWDIEKTLEVNASSLALTGLVLSIFSTKRWLFIPVVVTGFLLQHGLQGWCPPVTLFRSLGIRTRQEIDEEIYALKVLRGDFDAITSASRPSDIMESFRR
jgi:hypothetical protein